MRLFINDFPLSETRDFGQHYLVIIFSNRHLLTSVASWVFMGKAFTHLEIQQWEEHIDILCWFYAISGNPWANDEIDQLSELMLREGVGHGYLTGVAWIDIIIDYLVHSGPVIFGFHSCHDFLNSKMSSSSAVVMVGFEGFKSKVSGQSKLLNPFIFILLIAFDSSLKPVI